MSDSVLAKAKRIIHSGRLSKHELDALDILGYELKSLKHEEGGQGMKQKPAANKKAERKHIVLKPVTRAGWGGRGQSNFDAYGTTVSPKKVVGNLDDGIYMVKEGVMKRMADTNGTGNVCVVYRVPAKVEEPAKPIKKKLRK
jgi:hypothetical protein